MAPILNKPIIERVMDTMILNGIGFFLIVASPEDREIIEYFENQSTIEADIKIIKQPRPLGMGHALKQAAPYVNGDFILSSCDNLVDPREVDQMLSIWFEEKPKALLTTLLVGPEEIVRMGIVELDGNLVTRIVEKPTLETAPSNIGSVPLYVFSNKFLNYLTGIQPSQRGEYELQDAIQGFIEREDSVWAFPLKGRMDLTNPEDLLSINCHFLRNIPDTNITNLQNVGSNTVIRNPVFFGEDVKIGSNCLIGPYVFMEKGCQIGNDVQLQNCVVLRDRSLPDESVVKDRVIC
jgi:dTDP-glucose pyrophosphorylase